MVTFGKKKTIGDYLYTKTGVALLVVVIALLSTAVYKRFTVEQEMSLRTQEAENQKQILLERKSALEDKVQYLSGDRGTEEEIRKDFDVAKNGEKVIILTGSDAQDATATPPAAPEVKKPWYQFW